MKGAADECSAVLTPKEMNLITVFPDVMDFGNISPHVKVSKSFAVSNDNKHAIIVSVWCKAEGGVIHIHPETQVIRAGCTAGFDVSIFTEVLQDIRAPVQYRINGAHDYSFQVKAHPIPGPHVFPCCTVPRCMRPVRA